MDAQVDFDGDHPVEGAKEVGTLMTRYVNRAMRLWEERVREQGPAQSQMLSWVAKQSSEYKACPHCPDGHLQLAPDLPGLVVVDVER